MAYDEYQADRIHQILTDRGANYFAKKMFSGLVFMVNEKMLCGVHYDKKKETDLLMARIGDDAFEKHKDRTGCQPMDFTGRVMKGYVFITPDGYDLDEDLEFWINLCLDFNPFAKASKKKKKKPKEK